MIILYYKGGLLAKGVDERVLYAMRYLQCMGNGLTKPWAFECDDGNQYLLLSV